MRILMILIPDNQSRPTLKIGQVAEPYYLFRDSGAEVVFASPDGGAAVPTAASQDRTTSVRRLRGDNRAREALADTLSLDQVSTDDFQAAICIGTIEGIDAEASHKVSLLIAQLCGEGKPVAQVSETASRHLLITGNDPRAATQALLGAIRSAQPKDPDDE
jgi:hypothetical protein